MQTENNNEDVINDKKRKLNNFSRGERTVIEVSGVSNNTITCKLLVSNKIKESLKALFSKIYSDLLKHNIKYSFYNPNFEDIFKF